ncbi:MULTISPECIES: hypothetical protein [unclassified Streptomyces]|uniref:hypothetical protein n=1 Tax=unclassified Streptomyces TaxID=2593676 RepID=UPI0035D8120E
MADDLEFWNGDDRGIPPYIRQLAAKVYHDLPDLVDGPEVVTDAILDAVVPVIRAQITSERSAVRAQVAADLRAKAARDWPGVGLLLEDIIAVVVGGVDGEPQ